MPPPSPRPSPEDSSAPPPRPTKLHIPLRSVLDRAPDEASPFQRVDAASEPLAGEDGRMARPSSWLADEDLTPEERALRDRHRRRRYLVCGLLGGLVLLGLVFARPLGKSIKTWQAHRLARTAEELLRGRDWAQAYPLLRDAVGLSVNDVFANRIMAEFQNRAGTSDALAWWVRVNELDPGVTAHRLRLVHAAVREQELALAAKTLGEVPPAERATAGYCEAATALEIARGNAAGAAEFLQQWRRLEPNSEAARLNGAIAQLSATTEAEVSYARETLQALSASPQVGRAAKRALVRDALRRGDFPGAAALVRPLAEAADGFFEDRILELEVLVRAGDQFSGVRVKQAQEAAGEDPVQIVALARWLFLQKRFSEAFGWLKSLPPSLRLRPPVAIALADATMSIRDWNGLDRTLRPQEWGSSEFLRIVYLARAAREQGRAEAAHAWWKRALELAGEPLQRTSLLRLVNSWGWRKEAEELLGQIRLVDPENPEPLEALEKILAANGDTRGLLRLAQERLGQEPSSVRARNDQAALQLLLGERLAEAHAAADEIAASQPGQPLIQATRAFSLLLRGRSAEALAVLRRLSDSALRQPGVVLYHGLALAAAGQAQAAESCFKLAEEQGHLLPEERALLERARTSKK